jgi:hypothetical protein
MSPVIINEFELVAAPPDGGTEGEPGVAETQQAANPPAQSPVLEIERVIRRREQRAQRVWAH